MADRLRRDETRVEVDAVHERVRGHHVECVANGFQDGCIVAWADSHPRGNCQAARDARDERVLTQIVGDG